MFGKSQCYQNKIHQVTKLSSLHILVITVQLDLKISLIETVHGVYDNEFYGPVLSSSTGTDRSYSMFKRTRYRPVIDRKYIQVRDFLRAKPRKG